jgi:hypothetical protein
MNKKFFIAWIAIFVLWMLGDFVVHGLLLESEYQKLSNLYRSIADSQNYFPFMLGAHVLMAGAFVWIYARGAEAKPWLAQGLRFGAAVALLALVGNYLIYYAVQPLPGMMVLKQVVFSGVLALVLGVAVAFLYRQGDAAG